MTTLLIPIKCDECGLEMYQAEKHGENDYGCEVCGHPVPTELVKESRS